MEQQRAQGLEALGELNVLFFFNKVFKIVSEVSRLFWFQRGSQALVNPIKEMGRWTLSSGQWEALGDWKSRERHDPIFQFVF